MVQAHAGSHRSRLYPPLVTLGLFVDQALSQDRACQDAVARHLSERTARGQSPCSLNTGPYCKARQRLPLALITAMAETVGNALESSVGREWRWRERSVKLMDGTTLSMPDTPDNQARYPQSGGQKSGLGFPLAMMVGILSLSTGAVLSWALGPCRGKLTGEQALFRGLMPGLNAGDIVLADRYHCNYFTAALLLERGVDLVTRQHQRRITDFQCGKRLGKRDQLVDWIRPKQPSWMDNETYARMPETLSMRQTEVAGRILVTTLTDAQAADKTDIDALYCRRWQIEVDFRSIKAELGMDILTTKCAPMIDKEIAVYLLAYNLVRSLMARAAAGARVAARSLSFKGSVQLLQAFQQTLRLAGNKRYTIMSAHLIGAISLMRLPVRPSRVEPHAVKRGV